MIGTGAMADLTLKRRHGRIRVRLLTVGRAEDNAYGLTIVTTNTGIRSRGGQRRLRRFRAMTPTREAEQQ